MEKLFTTNIREIGNVAPMRVKLTATAKGDLRWCELWFADGTLKGCGPSLVGLSGQLLDAARDRLGYDPESFPMYWMGV